MDFNLSKTKVDIANQVSKILIFALIGITIVAILEGILLFKFKRDAKVIVVPPIITQPFTVSNTSVDQSYLQQMTLFLIGLKLNVTPKTVAATHQLFLDYVAPEVYGAVEKQLIEETEAIKAGDISASFSLSSIIVDAPQLMVKVSGILKRSSGSNILPDDNVTYLVRYELSNGTVKLLSLSKWEKKHA